MNKLLWSFLLLITSGLNALTCTSTYANEGVSCLFCHQYPGLVRLQQDKSLKILHINPELYRKSSHGKLGCQECHKGINKIPHVGANKIECTSGCHQSSKDQLLLKQNPLTGFHDDQQSYIARLPDQTSCKVCHPVYPHSKAPFTRAWLNMHTGYIICETCHIKKEKYPDITYKWMTTRYVEFKGQPFGSFFDPDKKHTGAPESSLSRIVPFSGTGRYSQSLVNFDDTDKAREFLASSTQLDSEDMQLAMDYYHRDIEKMDKATVCETCHSPNGMLDFNALGFTEERAKVLTNIKINTVLSHYKDFYIPHIFK